MHEERCNVALAAQAQCYTISTPSFFAAWSASVSGNKRNQSIDLTLLIGVESPWLCASRRSGPRTPSPNVI